MIKLPHAQVIGGIQRYSAICRVNELGGRKISNRKCCIYGHGLARQAALVLARHHNEYNLIQRSTSFAEVSACCRRLLYSHFASEGVTDDGEMEPTVPRYNSTRYRVFKQECLTFMLSTQTVSK